MIRKDLKKLFALHINHPYQETLKMRFLSDEKDRLEEAEKLYKEVLEINPDDYNSSIGVADCFLYMDKLEEAKELYIALIRRNAYDNYVRNQIMNVNEKLIEYYKQEDKHDTISIFKRAWCLFENFRYQEIIDLTEGMTVEEENENQYCDLLGKTYAGLKQYEKSIEYFKQWSDKLEKETDENEDRDYNLNYLYSEIGNQYKKLERYDEALIYSDMDNNDQALKYVQEAIKIARETKYYYARAYYYKYKKDFENALSDYDYCINQFPEDTFAYVRKAEIYKDLNDPEKSLALYKKVLEITKEAYYYICRGIAYDDLKRYDEALNDYQEAIKLDPENPHAYNNIGIVYKEKKDFETYVKMGEAYKELHDTVKAKENYQKALDYYNKVLEIVDSDDDTEEAIARVKKILG